MKLVQYRADILELSFKRFHTSVGVRSIIATPVVATLKLTDLVLVVGLPDRFCSYYWLAQHIEPLSPLDFGYKRKVFSWKIDSIWLMSYRLITQNH